ncbi:hypothetical protein F5X99DRAFT_13284 [Biscogniauxia marginata]|nr:hypothetical protein F5X99DRAFT_13284 [Biscogniauxia marginata]
MRLSTISFGGLAVLVTLASHALAAPAPAPVPEHKNVPPLLRDGVPITCTCLPMERRKHCCSGEGKAKTCEVIFEPQCWEDRKGFNPKHYELRALKASKEDAAATTDGPTTTKMMTGSGVAFPPFKPTPTFLPPYPPVFPPTSKWQPPYTNWPTPLPSWVSQHPFPFPFPFPSRSWSWSGTTGFFTSYPFPTGLSSSHHWSPKPTRAEVPTLTPRQEKTEEEQLSASNNSINEKDEPISAPTPTKIYVSDVDVGLGQVSEIL